MSNELYETREAMLSIAHPERWLRLADSQLKAWEEQRDQFILPREQVLIKPIIEYYAGDAEGWARFVRSAGGASCWTGRSPRRSSSDGSRTP